MCALKRTAVVVDQSRGIVCKRRIIYQLLKRNRRRSLYFIRIKFKDEVALEYAGSVLSEATLLYEKIVKNLVTPCTLHYIVEDYFAENFN